MKLLHSAAIAALVLGGAFLAPASAAPLQVDHLQAQSLQGNIVEVRHMHMDRGRHMGWRRHHDDWRHRRHMHHMHRM